MSAVFGPDMQTQLDVLREADGAIQHFHDSDSDLDARRLCQALESLVALFGLKPSPVEHREILRAMPGVNPQDYVALPVVATPMAPIPVQPSSKPQVVPNAYAARDPDGQELLIMLLQVQLPLAMFKTSNVFQANGAAPNPLEGMFPLLPMRLLVPNKRLAPAVAEALGTADQSESPPLPFEMPLRLFVNRKPWDIITGGPADSADE